jgi:hypothetical protein
MDFFIFALCYFGFFGFCAVPLLLIYFLEVSDDKSY